MRVYDLYEETGLSLKVILLELQQAGMPALSFSSRVNDKQIELIRKKAIDMINASVAKISTPCNAPTPSSKLNEVKKSLEESNTKSRASEELKYQEIDMSMVDAIMDNYPEKPRVTHCYNYKCHKPLSEKEDGKCPKCNIWIKCPNCGACLCDLPDLQNKRGWLVNKKT